jgi:hypothetical protein
MQCWDRSTYGHEKQLSTDPSEHVVDCPGLIGAVQEFGEILCLRTRASQCEHIQAEYNAELRPLNFIHPEVSENGSQDQSKARVRESIESYKYQHYIFQSRSLCLKFSECII